MCSYYRCENSVTEISELCCVFSGVHRGSHTNKYACTLSAVPQKSAFPVLKQQIYHLGLVAILRVKVNVNGLAGKSTG